MMALYISDIRLIMRKKGKDTKFQKYDIPTPPVELSKPTRPVVLQRIETSEEYEKLLGSVLIQGPALPYRIPDSKFMRFMDRFLSDKNIDRGGQEKTHLIKYELTNVKFSSRIMSKTDKI